MNSSKPINLPAAGPPNFLALGVNVANWPCLVVGGGRIGSRKALTLAEYRARVTVLAPRIGSGLQLAVQQGWISWQQAEYAPELLSGHQLVVAATDDSDTNLRIAADAERLGLLYCNTSSGQHTKVLFPAVHQGDDFLVAVHTHGRSPRRSAMLRTAIAQWLSTWFNRSAKSRPETCHNPSATNTTDAQPTGRVFLVGAGPGAADLITLRGLRAIQQADLVIYDRILGKDFAAALGIDPTETEIVWLGGPERHSQEQICDQMLTAAQAGRIVARVKNGDPFVFGRGAEELEFLATHGITCEVVPGVSSSLGVLSAAGYALTNRGTGRSFAVTSAHLAGGVLNQNYPLADSLVVLMAVGVLDAVVQHLLACGYGPDTPAVLIERGTQPEERQVCGPLNQIAQLAGQQQIESPAILAVGQVASQCYHPTAAADHLTSSSPTPIR